MSIDVNRDFIFEQSKYFYCQLTQFLLTIHKKNLHNVSSTWKFVCNRLLVSRYASNATYSSPHFWEHKNKCFLLKKNLILFLIFDNKIDGDWF